MSNSDTVRVAAAQVAPVFLDRDATVAKGVSVIEEAGRNGAQLLAFPETWVPAYPLWIYGAAGWDDAAAKRAFARLQANSVEVPSPATDALCAAARRASVMVVMGINERDARYSRGTLYNTQLVISADGELSGIHRKLVPTHAERLMWGVGDGSTLSVVDTPFGRVGGLVCWENFMPLARQAMHAQGEQIHVASWPEVPDIHHLASRHYAFEGRCFVICVGAYMRLADVPDGFELKHVLGAAGAFAEDPDLLLPGGSGIIGPDSQWIAGPAVGREEIVCADIDLARVAEEQMGFDAVGHYNRPDVFRLTVDTRARPHVAWIRDPAAGGRDSTPAEDPGAIAATGRQAQADRVEVASNEPLGQPVA